MEDVVARILLVDNDTVTRRMGARMLLNAATEQGFQCKVDSASSGENAVEYVINNEYDLIVMDVVMDGIGGLGAIKKIKEELHCTAPIIVSSGFLSIEEQLEAKNSSRANGVLPKPFRKVDMAAIITKWIAPAIQEKEDRIPPLKLKALLVDNERVARLLGQRRFQEVGKRYKIDCQVDVVGSGEGSISALLRTDYDLVVMDVVMPGLGGVAAMRVIREDLCNPVPLAVCSAFLSGEEQRHVMRCSHANFTLRKPLRDGAIARLLRGVTPVEEQLRFGDDGLPEADPEEGAEGGGEQKGKGDGERSAGSSLSESKRKQAEAEAKGAADGVMDDIMATMDAIRLRQVGENHGKLSWSKGALLGEGGYANVYRGLNQDTGEFLAVKELKLRKVTHRADGRVASSALATLRALQVELGIMLQLDHPNIVRCIGADGPDGDGNLFLLLEYVPGGSIHSMVHQFGCFSEEIVRKYLRQTLLGLQYLHSKEFVHRDIKGANVLVTDDGTVKLADFGCSLKFDGEALRTNKDKQLLGSIPWMAPEVIRRIGASYASDIWSIGCTMIEMLTAQRPWSEFNNQASLLYHIAHLNSGPPLPESLSPLGEDFASKIFLANPKKRWTATQLLEHPFLAPTSSAQ